MSFNDYNVSSNAKVPNNINLESLNAGGLFLIFFSISDNYPLTFSSGIGVVRSSLTFNPKKEVNLIINNPNYSTDNLKVTYVHNLENRIIVPFNISYTLSEPKIIIPYLLIIPGSRFYLGIESNFSLNRISLDNIVLNSTNSDSISDFEFNDSFLKKAVNKYYSTEFNNLQFLTTYGFEIYGNNLYGNNLSTEGFMGFKLKTVFVPYIKGKVKKTNVSFEVYFGLSLPSEAIFGVF